MKQYFYSGESSHLFILMVVIGSYGIIGCNQAEQKAKSVIASKDSSPSLKYEYDRSQPPYVCAIRSLKALEKGDLETLLTYVHPAKGLTITHVGESIQNHEKTFSVEELKREVKKPTILTIVNDYEPEDMRKSTLSSLLKHYAGSNSFQNNSTQARLFSTSKDVRRNYTGNGTYSLVPPLGDKQTTISYHFSDSANEMNWEEIVLRTETYNGKDYLVEILRAYWTP